MSEKSGIDSVNDEIDELAAETILKPDIYRSIFSLEDESDIVLAKDQLEEKARALKKLSPVREMLKVSKNGRKKRRSGREKRRKGGPPARGTGRITGRTPTGPSTRSYAAGHGKPPRTGSPTRRTAGGYATRR